MSKLAGQTIKIGVTQTEGGLQGVIVDGGKRYTAPGNTERDALLAVCRVWVESQRSVDDSEKVSHVVDVLGVQVSQARVLAVLMSSYGKTVPQDVLSQRVRDMSGDYPSLYSMKTSITRLRRALREHDEPHEIVAVSGLGWRIQPK